MSLPDHLPLTGSFAVEEDPTQDDNSDGPAEKVVGVSTMIENKQRRAMSEAPQRQVVVKFAAIDQDCIRETLNRAQYTIQERFAVWYRSRDYDGMRSELRKIVEAQDENGESPSNNNASGDVDMGEMRGCEELTEKGAVKLKERRQTSLKAILQDRDVNDYILVSRESFAEAYFRGLQDYKLVRRMRLEDRKLENNKPKPRRFKSLSVASFCEDSSSKLKSRPRISLLEQFGGGGGFCFTDDQ